MRRTPNPRQKRGVFTIRSDVRETVTMFVMFLPIKVSLWSFASDHHPVMMVARGVRCGSVDLFA